MPTHQLLELALRLLRQDEDRSQDAGLRAAPRPPGRRPRTAHRARLQRSPGHRRPAVPVAVGLDHHPQGRRCHGLGQHPDVAGDGTEIDLDPGPSTRVGRRDHNVSSSGGSRAGRSEARKPRAGPRWAAAPWIHAPAAAASKAGTCWANSAPMMPANTSPEPAVANRSSPVVESRTRPARLGHDRGRPFQEHDRTGLGRQRPDRRDAVRTRAPAGEEPELAVVGREHARRRPGPEDGGRAVRRPGQGEEAVPVHHHRGRRGGHQLSHFGRRGVAPAEARPDDEGVEAVEVLGDGGGPGHGR